VRQGKQERARVEVEEVKEVDEVEDKDVPRSNSSAGSK
jgi:hypothetical protein